jgi:hypothetical protein
MKAVRTITNNCREHRLRINFYIRQSSVTCYGGGPSVKIFENTFLIAHPGLRWEGFLLLRTMMGTTPSLRE